MSKSVKTEKGTVLPLVNLKGKEYLMVGHRLQWFNERETNFSIHTDLVLVNDEQTVARATVSVYDKDGKPVKSATATKRETKKDFSDHTEKAETSAVGRALAMLGYGTQFALSDLDEGKRIVDSPMEDVKPKTDSAPTVEAKVETPEAPPVVEEKKPSSFRRPKANGKAAEPAPAPVESAGGWE